MRHNMRMEAAQNAILRNQVTMIDQQQKILASSLRQEEQLRRSNSIAGINAAINVATAINVAGIRRDLNK